MNVEREQMRGRLVSLQTQRKRLRLTAEGLASGIRTGLNTALTDIEQIETALIAQQMDDLVAAMGELAALQGQIARLERELK
jgi:transposase